MKYNSKQLLEELRGITNTNIEKANHLLSLSDEALNWKPNDDKWSVLECIKHLNFYADFYHQEIASKLNSHKTSQKEEFKSGWFGNYFTNSMRVKEGKIKPMKTFKVSNFAGSNLTKDELTIFIKGQRELLTLLEQSEKVDLGKIRCNISISKLIKLKLGDTFNFLIRHNERHIWQAENVLKNYNSSK